MACVYSFNHRKLLFVSLLPFVYFKEKTNTIKLCFTLCKYNCLIIPVCFGGQADVLRLDVDNDENRLRAILADLEEDKFLVVLDLVLAEKNVYPITLKIQSGF